MDKERARCGNEFRQAFYSDAMVNEMNIFADAAKSTLPAALMILAFTSTQSACLAKIDSTHEATGATIASAKAFSVPVGTISMPAKNIMTLEHLKNACYQVPDLACGYREVQLKDGRGTTGDERAVFGRATFGKINGFEGTAAAVHIAYENQSLGWSQEIVFITQKGGQLLQVAEYNLDDSEQLTGIEIKDGEVIVDTKLPANQSAEAKGEQLAQIQKVTKFRLSQSSTGCMVEASEWQRVPGSNQLKAYVDLAPYLSTVEDRVSECWSPTQKDRGEHVVVTFKIKPSGDVADVQLSGSSEVATADAAALEAVQNAAPFPPLPQGNDQSIEVCFDFQANVSARSGH